MNSNLDDRIDGLKADIDVCDEEARKWTRRKENYKDELRILEEKRREDGKD